MAQSEASPVSILRRGPPGIGAVRNSPVIWMTGDYDVATVDALSGEFSSAIAFGDDDLVVDLSEVSFMDAATIGVIVRANAFLAGRGRSMGLRDPSRCARRILGICGLDPLIEPAVDDPGSMTPATALESWVAVPATAAERDRSLPPRLGPAKVQVAGEVVPRPNPSLVDATAVACPSPRAVAMRERQ